eukprot:947242-Pyramimonas_sp.AAC.1
MRNMLGFTLRLVRRVTLSLFLICVLILLLATFWLEPIIKPFFIRTMSIKTKKMLVRAECSSAQPIMSSPDVLRAERCAREVAGTTPRPSMKKPKSENDDSNASPLQQ